MRSTAGVARKSRPARLAARRGPATWLILAPVALALGPAALAWGQAPPVTPPAGKLLREVWDVFFVQGARMGYAHTTVRELSENDERLIQVEMVYRLKLKRFGQVSEEELRISGLETPTGQVRSFATEMNLGPTPMTVRGRVIGDQMRLETTTAGKTVPSQIPWSDKVRGFYAADQTLLSKPMQPGERRTLQALMPPLNVVAQIDLVARGFERTPLLNGSYELLRIESRAQLPGGVSLDTVLWVNRRGEVLKSHSDALAQDSYRVTKAEALDEAGTEAFDLGADSVVHLARPLPGGHASQRVRYRLRLPGSDPSAVFASGPTQQVQAIDDQSAELTVSALSLAQPPADPGPAEPPPGDDDRRANSLIQSDHPTVVALARQAAPADQDPRQVALALEQFVHENITQKNFSQAFATAAEVAETREGDCTEHAVLLAALARARGIPARVAVGLVYMPQAQAFGYHMWNEVYLSDRWWPLDATLAQGGIGAAHLKLAHSSLAGASAYTSLLPVAQVLGRLELEVLQAE